MTETTARRVFHMQATINYAIRTIEDRKRNGEPQDFVSRGGVYPNHEDAIAILRQMQDDGMVMVPCCEFADATGKCQGFER